MPRYYFDCADGDRIPDTEGTELPNAAAAHLEAIAFAGEVLKGKPQELWNLGHWRVEVCDEDGYLLFTVATLAIDAPPRNRRRNRVGGQANDV